jgi:DNA-binding XRE family transcriptional regulator
MFSVRSEPLPWATIPLRRQLNHPKGGCITPLRRLKASCGAHGEEANHHCAGQTTTTLWWWASRTFSSSGQAVRARRLELGTSQTELAERAGMTQSAVSRLEAGGTVPTIGVLERLATALSADLVVTLTPKAA